jgi:hypothetical protein
METTVNKIRIKQLEIQVEMDPAKKQELQAQLRKLQLKKEIEDIRVRIDQIG